jgi:hypothetical protein
MPQVDWTGRLAAVDRPDGCNTELIQGETEREYLGIQVSRYPGIQVSRYPGIQVSRYPGIQVSRYPGIQVPRYPAAGPWVVQSESGLALGLALGLSGCFAVERRGEEKRNREAQRTEWNSQSQKQEPHTTSKGRRRGSPSWPQDPES